MVSPYASRTRTHFSQEQWLDLALDMLSRSGRSRLHLDSLIEAMPVTKGSFYHHFHGKPEFLRALVRFWVRKYTDEVIGPVGEAGSQEPASQRLWKLMWAVAVNDYARFEPSLRNLALGRRELADLLAEVDEQRFRFVNGLFSELGFSGTELETRTRAFIAATQQDLGAKPPSKARLEEILRARYAFFVRP